MRRAAALATLLFAVPAAAQDAAPWAGTACDPATRRRLRVSLESDDVYRVVDETAPRIP